MGASLALGGLAGCRWEEEKIAPFAMRPENRIPGEAEFFATSIEIAGMPRHLLATCLRWPTDEDRRESRPPRQPRCVRRVVAGNDSRLV